METKVEGFFFCTEIDKGSSECLFGREYGRTKVFVLFINTCDGILLQVCRIKNDKKICMFNFYDDIDSLECWYPNFKNICTKIIIDNSCPDFMIEVQDRLGVIIYSCDELSLFCDGKLLEDTVYSHKKGCKIVQSINDELTFTTEFKGEFCIDGISYAIGGIRFCSTFCTEILESESCESSSSSDKCKISCPSSESSCSSDSSSSSSSSCSSSESSSDCSSSSSSCSSSESSCDCSECVDNNNNNNVCEEEAVYMNPSPVIDNNSKNPFMPKWNETKKKNNGVKFSVIPASKTKNKKNKKKKLTCSGCKSSKCKCDISIELVNDNCSWFENLDKAFFRRR